MSAMTFIDISVTFLDVTKHNGCYSVGTLYGKILDKIVFCYDNAYNQTSVKVRHINTDVHIYASIKKNWFAFAHAMSPFVLPKYA